MNSDSSLMDLADLMSHFRERLYLFVPAPSSNEDGAVFQQRSSGRKSCEVKIACGQAPPAGIIEFGARGRANEAKPSCNKDHAVFQQRRRVENTCVVEPARVSPGPTRRVVDFGAPDST